MCRRTIHTSEAGISLTMFPLKVVEDIRIRIANGRVDFTSKFFVREGPLGVCTEGRVVVGCPKVGQVV